MTETIDLSNLELEFEIIAHALQTGLLPEGVKSDDFYGTKARWIAAKLEVLGTACSIPLLLSELDREGQASEVESFRALLTRLVSQPVNQTAIPDSVKRVKELSNGRKLARLLTQSGGVADKLKNQQVTEAVNILESFLFSQETMDGVVNEGSLVGDAHTIMEEIHTAARHEAFKGVPTLIQPLDEVIYGLLPGEYGLFVGGTGEGKSMAMTDVGARNWEWGGKNVILFSIEMGKLQQELRLVSWAINIPIECFRSGEITPEQIAEANRFFERRQARRNLYYIVDVPQNITAMDIEKKLFKLERELHVKFDLVLIDYMGLMSPIGAFRTRIDWDAQAEISWNVHNLARRTEKAVWSAAQKKENISDAEKSKGTLRSIGLSYLIAQPADVCLVFTEKTLEGYMDVNIAKGRDVPKKRVRLKPDLRHGKLHAVEGPTLRNDHA